MKRSGIVSIAAFVLITSGCSTTQLQLPKLDGQLNGLHGQLLSARQAGGDTAPIQQQLSQVARDAASAASNAKNPKDVVAFYRVAAVAVWQAGPAGSSLVLPITDAGTAACEALPGKDADAPRDCSLIRIARPMAVQDGLALSLIELQQRLIKAQQDHERHCQTLQGAEATACRAMRGKLPATDLTTVQTLLNDFEAQFGKASDIRDGLPNLPLPPEFVTQTDNQRLIIYCNGVAAWSLSADVENGSATFNALTSRKAAMAQRLQGSAVQANCDRGMTTQTATTAMLN